jgi:hypothetical protein
MFRFLAVRAVMVILVEEPVLVVLVVLELIRQLPVASMVHRVVVVVVEARAVIRARLEALPRNTQEMEARAALPVAPAVKTVLTLMAIFPALAVVVAAAHTRLV